MNKQSMKRMTFILVLIMLFTVITEALPARIVEGNALKTFDGWSTEGGYSLTSTWVHEGSYALEHEGIESNAISDPILLEDGVTYFLSAAVRQADSDTRVTISFAGNSTTATTKGKWEIIGFNVLGKGAEESIKITASGNAHIDSITLNPYVEGENLIENGNFDDEDYGWLNVNKLECCMDVIGDRDEICLMTMGEQVATATQYSLEIEANTWYLLSADFYLTNSTGAPWLYVDMNDVKGELQIRGTLSEQWQTVSGLWYSGDRTITDIRIVAENNWDQPFKDGGFNGTGYVDNISLKKVTVGDDLVTDEGFENNGWQLNKGASIQSKSWFLYGKKSLKLENNASAIANGGKAIKVEPNSYYYFSAWAIRPGSNKVTGKITIKTSDGANELTSITGSRYNQTMWNPKEGRNAAEKETATWEQIGGWWFSGDNTEVIICAESTGSGIVYFDDVTFNSFEDRATGSNIFKEGNMESYMSETFNPFPVDSESKRVEAQYNSFLADNMASFPASFTIGNKSYSGFGTDFTLKNQQSSNVTGGVKTISELEHTSGLVFTVESVLYKSYNAYDWTIYISNPTDKNSPVICNFNAVDIIFEGLSPTLHGSVGDAEAYAPYTVHLDGQAVTKTPSGGRSTQGDSSYFEFQYGDKGVMYAIGWPGQWSMTLDNSISDDATRLTAGQQYFNTYLASGEVVRSPLMAFVHYDSRNMDRSTNLWRRWMIDCNMNRITEKGSNEPTLPKPAIFAATSIQWHEMTKATDENQINAIKYYLEHNIDITFWWMDAGWYYMVDSNGDFKTVPDWGWTNTGAWVVDDSRFPSKLKDISSFAAKHDIKTLLWFEPERIANSDSLRTDGLTVHPDWVLSGYLVDFGRPEAVEWTFSRIKKVMEEGDISMYREDFNCNPLPAWQAADAAKDTSGNRTGITENLHIQGHLRLWDSILEYFPNATIDSCASGGNRNDLETMRRAVPLHKTDHSYEDRTWQQAVATNMTRWIPYIGTKANGEKEADNNTTTANRYSLRTALVAAMVLGYDTDKTKAPIDWDIVEDITEEHKAISHLIYSDYYVLEQWTRSEREWAAWEYYDTESYEGYVLAFRRSAADARRTYKLKGLDSNTYYKVWFEDANRPAIRTGKDLMENGVVFALPASNTSDILHIKKSDNAPADRSLTTAITQVSYNGQYAGALLDMADITTEWVDYAFYYNRDEYVRFDIRFNMALRDTVFTESVIRLDKNVQNDYAALIMIDGKTVGSINNADAKNVVMDYDVVNNILNVYVKKDIFSASENHKVVISDKLIADGGAEIEGEVTYYYNAFDDIWSDGIIHVSFMRKHPVIFWSIIAVAILAVIAVAAVVVIKLKKKK